MVILAGRVGQASWNAHAAGVTNVNYIASWPAQPKQAKVDLIDRDNMTCTAKAGLQLHAPQSSPPVPGSQ